MSLEVAVPVLLTIISAATPLLLAAHRRARGRALGRAQPRRRGHDARRCGHRLRRRLRHRQLQARHPRRRAGRHALALIFGVLTLTLVSNQVATGLALTLFGIGLSALVGVGFVGSPIEPLPKLAIPGLADHPGPRPAPVRPGRPGLPLGGADARRRLVPQAHARRHDPARLRRVRRLGALDRLRRDHDPLPRRPVRRRDGRPRRRLPLARLHADVGREHDRRPRLDRARAGGVRLLAAGCACSPAPTCSAASPSSSSTSRAWAGSACRPRSCRCCPISPPSWCSR